MLNFSWLPLSFCLFFSIHALSADLSEIKSSVLKDLILAVKSGEGCTQTLFKKLLDKAESADATAEEMGAAGWILVDPERVFPLGCFLLEPRRGFLLLEKAEKLGDIEASQHLAFLYLHGYSQRDLYIPPDFDKALGYLQKHNTLDNQFLMGSFYYQMGKKTSPEQTINFLENSIRDSNYIIKGLRMMVDAADAHNVAAMTIVEEGNFKEELEEILRAWRFEKVKPTPDYEAAMNSF